MNSFVCKCQSGFTGRTCSQTLSIFSNQQVIVNDYSDTIARIEITSNALDRIKLIGDIAEVINPVAGIAFKFFTGIIELSSKMPSKNDIILDYMRDQYEYMKEQFNNINNNIKLIYNQINDLNNHLAEYFDQISEEIRNSQIVITAVSNINKMNVYEAEAKNLIIDLSTYLGQDLIYYPQIQQTCGLNYNPQHYLNIINQFTSTSIFDSSLAGSYNLVYNIMIINNYADYDTYIAWFKKMFLLAYNLAYYGTICDSTNNMSLVFQNQSALLRSNTLLSISNGILNQINELTAHTYYGKFIGCFLDNSTLRDLPSVPYKIENMNVEFCINHCQSYGYS